MIAIPTLRIPYQNVQVGIKGCTEYASRSRFEVQIGGSN